MKASYRKNVGVVVTKKGKVLLCARADQKNLQWQFPQGGMEADEDVEKAALRELKEETGIFSVKLKAVMPQTIRYDFPNNNIKKWGKDSYRGQEQKWVLFDFYGEDEEIDFLTHPEEIEFKAFKWADISEAVENIVSFKKNVYQKVAAYFKPLIEEEKDE